MTRHAQASAAVAGVLAPPLLLFGIDFVLGLPADRQPLTERFAETLRRGLALLAVAAGGALSASASRALRAADTPTTPRAPTSAIVAGGPFRWTRNPDYRGQMLMYIGAAVLVGRRGPLLLFPALARLVQRTVVEREEAYLAHRFGETYTHYQARVPRWL